MSDEPNAPHWTDRWTPVVAVVSLVVLARLVYLIWLTPYTLAEDEAHYWEWSHRLDWSYYSKGPGVAWAIALATSIFGNHEWAVRLPTVLAHGIAALAACGLARDAFAHTPRAGRAGLYAAGAVLLIPSFQALSILMTIDGPYLACWMLCSWLAFRATVGSNPMRPDARPQRGWRLVGLWALAGLAFAVGFWFKYTILILAPGLVAMAWSMRSIAPTARTLKGVAVLLVVGLGVGVLPVAIWNSNHDWATIRHLMGHLGMSGGDISDAANSDDPAWSPLWVLEYLGMLAAMVGPLLFLAITEAVDLRRERAERPRSATIGLALAAMALPVLIMYFFIALLITNVEGNWALAGAIGLTPLIGHAAARAADRVHAMRARNQPVNFRTRPLPSHLWRAGVMLGVGAGVVMLRLDLLERFPRIRDLVPSHRLIGMDTHGQEVHALVTALGEQTGLDPFVMTRHYGRASQLAFYVPGHPTTYAAQAQTGGRKTQYDIWAETDLMNRDTQLALTGRPAVLVGGELTEWNLAFERVEELGVLDSDPSRSRKNTDKHHRSYFGFGYRGFPAQDFNDPRVGESLIGDPAILGRPANPHSTGGMGGMGGTGALDHGDDSDG
jgi:hypothetical protein